MMRLFIDGCPCIIQAYELDDDIYHIEDRAKLLFFNIGVAFEEGMVYHAVKYFFENKALKFSYSTEELLDKIEAFIIQNHKEIIEKILGWESDYSRSLEIKDNDIVLIKESFSIATITGVYMSKDYFEVDNDEESYHHRDELVLWARDRESD